MRHASRWAMALPVALAVVGLAGTGCDGSSTTNVAASAEVEPAKVEPVAGTDSSKVTLTEEAAKRLDVQTGTVRDAQVAGKARKVVPYSAVIYGAKGDTWTFTMPRALTYVREPIQIESITGDMAVLSAGPAIGTVVVTVGSVELYGAELGVGK
jgi:hypothetical protein